MPLLRRSEFYEEWLRPLELDDGLFRPANERAETYLFHRCGAEADRVVRYAGPGEADERDGPTPATGFRT